MTRFTILLTTALAGTLFALPQAALAQEAAPEPEAGGIEDIVVTARRTEESLQTTPVAVTALSSQALVQAQVRDVSDLQRTVPSLVISKGTAGTSGFALVAIRGQGNLQPILANDPAVATYIDGVYFARPSVGLTDLQDIQRVEVLRGPQGTLFGRNTTGGAVNIISKDPGPDFSGELRGEVGNIGFKNFAATLNAPIADNLAVRLNYAFREHDGFGESLPTGRRIGNVNSHFARGKIKYEGNGWDVTLSGDYNKMKDTGQNIQLAAVNTGLINASLRPGFSQAFFGTPNFAALTPAQQGQVQGFVNNLYINPLTAGLHRRDRWWDNTATGTIPASGIGALPPAVQALYGRKPFNRLEVYGFGGTVNIELGGLNLKSITAYRHNKNEGLNDTDATAAALLATFSGSTSKYYSQEVQISGDVTDALSFIAGGYYGHEEGEEYSRSQIFGGRLRDSTSDIVNKTFGLFAQGYYDITDTLRAVGGFRYTWDKRESVLHNAQVLGLPYNAPVAGTPTGINCTVTAPDSPPTATTCNQTQNASFQYPAWTAGLDWQATDGIFVYAKTSGAAKAGGWNLRAGGLPAFKPEKVKDVELGVKADLFDRHVRINSAVFHTWKSNNQAIVNSFVPGIGVTQYIQNNGKARIWGIENELTVIPYEGLEIGANLSLLDGKYEKGSFSETQVIAGSGCPTINGVANSCVVDLTSLPLIQLPKTQVNISAKQTFQLANDAELSVQGAYAYISRQVFNQVKPADQQSQAVKDNYAIENRLGIIPGYGLFNARVALKIAEPDIEFAAFMRNIANKKFLIRSFSDLYRQLGIAAEYAGEGRSWGFSMTAKF